MASMRVVFLFLGFFLSTQPNPSLQGGAGTYPFKPAKAAVGGSGGTAGVQTGGLGPGGFGVGGYGAYGGAGRFYPGTGSLKGGKSGSHTGSFLQRGPGTDGTSAGLPGQVIPKTSVQGGAGGKPAKTGKAPVPGVGVPGPYQGGLAPGQGFNGRGVLPGVATGTGLKPKSAAVGGQGLVPGPGGRGPLQQGVFHGYPLKSPKASGSGSPYTGGKLPYGYSGFGGGAGLPGGKVGSKPGYPTGTGVGSVGVSASQAKPAKCGTGAGFGGTGTLQDGSVGLYPGAGGVGAIPGGAGIVPGTAVVQGAGGIYPGVVFPGKGGVASGSSVIPGYRLVSGIGGLPGTVAGTGGLRAGAKPSKYGVPGGSRVPGVQGAVPGRVSSSISVGGYPAGVKLPKYVAGRVGKLPVAKNVPGVGTSMGAGKGPVLGTGIGLGHGAGIGGVGITGSGAAVPGVTPGGTGLLLVPGGKRVSVSGVTVVPAAPSGKPAKLPTLTPMGTAVPGVTGHAQGPYYSGAGSSGIGTGVLPGAKPYKTPGAGGAGLGGVAGARAIPRQTSGGGAMIPAGVGLGTGAKPPKPGYDLLTTGYAQPGGAYPGSYGGYPQAYPGGYGTGLTQQQVKAAKHGGALSGFLAGGYLGGAGCQGKYCGRRRK